MRVGQVPGYIDGFTSLQLRPLRTCNTNNNTLKPVLEEYHVVHQVKIHLFKDYEN